MEQKDKYMSKYENKKSMVTTVNLIDETLELMKKYEIWAKQENISQDDKEDFILHILNSIGLDFTR